jgi:uncharacterized protein YcbX
MASIAGLYIYPVKSCRGIAHSRSRVATTGLPHDRRWMIVRAESGPARFLTQREVPALALVTTAIADGETLTLARPGAPPCVVEVERSGEPRDVVVWRDTLTAVDQGDAVAAWLSAHVGMPVRLVRFDGAGAHRACNPQFAGDSGAHTMFADGYPILVIGGASLADLNARLAGQGHDALPMNRFRPNLVVDGLEAFDEDHVAALRIGDVELRLVKPCARCQITTTDQATAVVGDEPLATLAGYRFDPRFDGITFGMNAIVVKGDGASIAVGDPVEVVWNF